LDIGTGFGIYGFLARDYLDVYQGRPYKETWEVNIEGIEAWEPYISAVHRHVYDAVHIGDAVEAIDTLGQFEMIIAGDVIEHFQREKGENLIRKMIAHSSKWVLVSVPMGQDWPQEASGGNPFQAHQSVWLQRDLSKMGFSLKEFRDENLRPYCVGLFTQNGVKSFDMAEVQAKELYLAAQRKMPLLAVLRSGIRHLVQGR